MNLKSVADFVDPRINLKNKVSPVGLFDHSQARNTFIEKLRVGFKKLGSISIFLIKSIGLSDEKIGQFLAQWNQFLFQFVFGHRQLLGRIAN